MNDKPKNIWQRTRQFLLHDVWDIDVSSLSAAKSFPVRIVRIFQLVIKGFKEDDLPVHASALTFVTLMSLVPMLAVAFALLRGFGFGQDEISKLLEWKDSMPPQFGAFVDQILSIVNSTNFAALGWVGLVFVVFTALLVLGSVEISFNRIWGVTASRTVFRQAANYISILVLVPLLIGVESTVEASLRGGLPFLPETVGFVVRNLLRITSFLTTWLAFIFLYIFLPNTRVRVLPAVVSSVVVALFWLGWQKSYIALQIGVARYNAIYGTFASVPIFLAWLYMSWVIVLLGAELAFALQNASTYRMESAADSASAKSKFILIVSVILHAAGALAGGPRFDTGAYARKHRVPIRLLNEMVRILVSRGFLAETAGQEGCFVLLKAPETIHVRDLVGIVAQEGAQPEALGLTKLDLPVERVLKDLESNLAQSIGDVTIKDLLPAEESRPA